MTREELQQKDIEALQKNISELKDSMKDGFKNVNDRLDTMNDHFIRKDLFEEKIKTMEEKILGLQDSNKWLFRTVLGTIITTIIGALAGTIFLLK